MRIKGNKSRKINVLFASGSFIWYFILPTKAEARSQRIQETTSGVGVLPDRGRFVLSDLQVGVHCGILVWGDVTNLLHRLACVAEIAQYEKQASQCIRSIRNR